MSIPILILILEISQNRYWYWYQALQYRDSGPIPIVSPTPVRTPFSGHPKVFGFRAYNPGNRGRRYYRNRSGIAILKSLVSVSVSILGNFQYQYQNRNRHSLKSGTPLNDFGHFIEIYVIKLVWLWYQYRNRNSDFSWYQYQYRNRPDIGKVSVSESVSKKLVSPAPGSSAKHF